MIIKQDYQSGAYLYGWASGHHDVPRSYPQCIFILRNPPIDESQIQAIHEKTTAMTMAWRFFRTRVHFICGHPENSLEGLNLLEDSDVDIVGPHNHPLLANALSDAPNGSWVISAWGGGLPKKWPIETAALKVLRYYGSPRVKKGELATMTFLNRSGRMERKKDFLQIPNKQQPEEFTIPA